MKHKEEIVEYLDRLFPNPKCELDYKKDYELLIATILSAQCTDARVNKATKILWENHDIFSLANANSVDIEKIIRPLGSFTKKTSYIIETSKRLVNDYNGTVPNNREYLESLSGVGRKTCNVVLSNLFNVPAIAVDTHVERVSKRLSLVEENDNVTIVEKKLMKIFPENIWSRIHHQLVLFGRYQCKARFPECESCNLKKFCKYDKKNK